MNIHEAVKHITAGNDNNLIVLSPVRLGYRTAFIKRDGKCKVIAFMTDDHEALQSELEKTCVVCDMPTELAAASFAEQLWPNDETIARYRKEVEQSIAELAESA